MNKPSANTQHSYNVALVHLWETKDVQVQEVAPQQYALPQSIQYAQMLVQSLQEIYGDAIHTGGKQYLKAAKAHRKAMTPNQVIHLAAPMYSTK